jgi:hypothetical protein
MQTLSHRQTIRLASWTHSFVTVGTLNGYCPNNADMARRRGDPECWAVYAGSTISSSPAFYERDRLRVSEATIVSDGEIVKIEGKQYRCSVVRGNAGQSPRNSDPIHFIAV